LNKDSSAITTTGVNQEGCAFIGKKLKLLRRELCGRQELCTAVATKAAPGRRPRQRRVRQGQQVLLVAACAQRLKMRFDLAHWLGQDNFTLQLTFESRQVVLIFRVEVDNFRGQGAVGSRRPGFGISD